MRYWFMSLALILFVVTVGDSQVTKKKPKEPDKTPSEKKETKVPEVPVPSEVAGKSFDAWRAQFKTTKDPSKRETAMKTLLMFGANKAYEAVPDIIAELNKHKPVSGSPVDLSVRVNGMMALSTIFKYKKEPDPKHIDEAFKLYRNALADPQIILRVRAVQGIIYLGPKAHEAIKDVMKVAKDPATWEARKEGIQSLMILAYNGPKEPDESATKEIISLLDDSSSLVRLAALQAVAGLSQTMSLSQKKLAEKKLDSIAIKKSLYYDDTVFIWAHMTIMQMKQQITKAHLAPIINMTASADAAVRSQAIQAVGSCGEKARKEMPSVVSSLVECLHDGDDGVSTTAAMALGALHAEEAIPALEKIMTDKTQTTDKKSKTPSRIRALQALGNFGTKGKPALSTVLTLIEDSEVNLAVTAISALVAMRADEAIPRLQKIVNDKKANETIQDAAAQAIEQLHLLAKMEKEQKEKGEKKAPEKK